MPIQFLNLHRILFLVATLGIFSGLYMLILDRRPAPVSQPITPPSISPFENFISGAGIVETSSENIGVGTNVSGTVVKIFVEKGDLVSKGQPLFTLDTRQAEATLKTRLAQLKTALTTYEQMKASLKLAQDLLNLVAQVVDKRGVSKEDLTTRQDNVVIAQKNLDNAKASVAAAQALVNEAQVNLNLYTTKAPIDGEIIQINIHPGEYAPASSITTPSISPNVGEPLIYMGSVNRYHIRVDVDENDAWRFNKGEPAVVFLRGNAQYHTNLKFEFIEPYVIPKRSLTGDSTERVDTRVLQVVYSYDPKAIPAYLGQEVDVYIQAPKISADVQYGGPLQVSR
jgi:HlyD family secretion protein